MKKINRMLLKKQILFILIIVFISTSFWVKGATVDQPFSTTEALSFFTPHSEYTQIEIKNNEIWMHGTYAYMSTVNNKIFSSTEDVYIEYQADIISQQVGFGKQNIVGGYEGIASKDGNVSIKKGGQTSVSNITTNIKGDIFRIEKKGQTIFYYKNGVKFYQEAYNLGDSFHIGVASSTGNSNVEGIKIGIIVQDISVVNEQRVNTLKVNTDILPDGYQVAVNGEMIIEGILVKDYEYWPDYVFEEHYHLKDLKELENQINELGHLPNIPSASEVLKDGVDIADMNIILLEKIEELTLYTIQQQKMIEKQQEQINLLFTSKNMKQ